MFKYVLRFHVRNLDRLAILLAVFILVVLFISTPIVISHANNIERIRSFIESLEFHGVVDASIEYRPGLLEEFNRTVSGLDGLDRFVLYAVIPDLFELMGNGSSYPVSIAMAPMDPRDFIVEMGLDIVASGEEGVYIHESLARRLDISPGDKIDISALELNRFVAYIPNLNLEFVVAGIYSGGESPYELFLGQAIIVDERSIADDVKFVGNLTPIPLIIVVWIDPGTTVDIQALSNQVDQILSTLSYEIREYTVGDVFTSNIFAAEAGVQSIIDLSVSVVASFSSIPYVFALVYLIYIALDLVSSSFRVDYGIMRLRGVTTKRLSLAFLTTLTLLFIIALLLGFIMGSQLTGFIAKSLGLSIDITPLVFSWDVILSTVVMGSIFIVIAYRKVHRQITSSSPVDVVREYLHPDAEESGWRLSAGLGVLYILSIIKLLEWIFGFTLNPAEAPGGVAFLVLVIYGIISSFMEVIAPIVLTYVTVNIVLHNTSLISKLSRLMSRISLPDLREIIVRYSTRFPRMIPKTSFLMSLVVFLMVYYMVFMGTSISFLNEVSSIEPPQYTTSIDVYIDGSVGLDDVVGDLSALFEGEDVGRWAIMVEVRGTVLVDGVVVSNNIPLRLVYSNYPLGDALGIRDWMLVGYQGDFPSNPWVDPSVKETLESTIGRWDNVYITYEPTEDMQSLDVFVDGYIVSPVGVTPLQPGIYVPYSGEDIYLGEGSYTIYILTTEDFPSVDPVSLDREIGWGRVLNAGFSSTIVEGFITNIFGATQRILYPYSIYGIAMVMIVVGISTVIYVNSVRRDLAILTSRGMGRMASSFAYSLIMPVMIFSLVMGASLGFIAGYGSSVSFITGFMGGVRVPYPIVVSVENLIGLLASIFLALALPLFLIRYRVYNMVREVSRVG